MHDDRDPHARHPRLELHRLAALAASLISLACAAQQPDRDEGQLSAGAGLGSATTAAGSSSSEGDTTETTDAVESTSTGAESSSSDDGPMAPKLDVGPGETDGDLGCPDDDICCVLPGELPPHALLDAFIEAYPPEAMPHGLAAMQSFVPMIADATIAYAALNTGDELVDAERGGLTEANLEAGRTYSRNAALAAVPADAVIADMREDPLLYLDLGGAGACNGVGWGWGSILFDAADGSIGELVFLYVGYCNSTDGDSEGFFYSDEATEICAAPD